MGVAIKEKTKEVGFQGRTFPLLPLRDIVIFPHTAIPLFIGRKSSVASINAAMKKDNYIFLATQKKESTKQPKQKDIHTIGTLANILQILKLPDGNIKILIEGIKRGEIKEFTQLDNYIEVKLDDCSLEYTKNNEIKAMMKLSLEKFQSYISISKKIPEEVYKALQEIKNIERFTDVIISNLNLSIAKKQSLLAESIAKKRLEKILKILEVEIELLGTEQKIQSRIRKQMESNQRDYYLNEQMKSIQKELGTLDDENEIEELDLKIEKAKMPKEAKSKAKSELHKLRRMSSQSSDASIIRTYIENLCNVPWVEKTTINKNIAKAQDILDSDHYGLDKVKERILEYLAVQSRVANNKANIICLIGPPGVGKTSLGESIAKAVNRKYIRMALGGIRDEAEIRGHRRTYIGAMPGSIVQKMQKAQVKNPLFLLDELDKMSSDYRGDSASAMLEVLDPEQNHKFNDHYLEIDYDLSQVMFLATANSFKFPQALLDRMEIIQISGYTEDEKFHIAKNHLIDKQMKNNGIKAEEIFFKDSAIINIIRYYTREAGVRDLDRIIGKICRKVVKQFTIKERKSCANINSKNLKDFLGVRKFRFGLAEKENQIGQVTGLAWTEMGGDLLNIEARTYKGKGKIKYTGQLGDVMKESIDTAISVTRSISDKFNISSDFYQKLDIHIHVPDGATPKDGPSAGISMCTALTSELTSRKVKADVAMTGEITLRGDVTPIGGLKEKLLAAIRGGIKTVLIPYENERDLSEISDKIKNSINIIRVKHIEEVLNIALE